MDEIVKNQFDNHLLVKMVLRVDEFFIMYGFAFFPVYTTTNKTIQNFFLQNQIFIPVYPHLYGLFSNNFHLVFDASASCGVKF